MRKISNYKEEKLREEQFGVLIKFIFGIKTNDDLELFLESFLSKSEVAYLSQRLNILRMLAKNFKYKDIQEKLNVPIATIANTKKILDFGGPDLRGILLDYKLKQKANKGGKNNLVNPHYPGAIKL